MAEGMTGMITIAVGQLEVNCYVVWDKVTKEAFVIDPGADHSEILDAVKEHALTVNYVVNTHGHFDHVGSDAEVSKALGAKLVIHENDAPLLADAHDHGATWGIKISRQPTADIYMKDGDELQAGSIRLKVLHTPGHTPGGVCLFEKNEGMLFTGDTLFAGSIGRTDFPGGSFEEIMSSINEKILPLGDNIKVYPGHGPSSTIGKEKKTNPYLTR